MAVVPSNLHSDLSVVCRHSVPQNVTWYHLWHPLDHVSCNFTNSPAPSRPWSSMAAISRTGNRNRVASTTTSARATASTGGQAGTASGAIWLRIRETFRRPNGPPFVLNDLFFVEPQTPFGQQRLNRLNITNFLDGVQVGRLAWPANSRVCMPSWLSISFQGRFWGWLLSVKHHVKRHVRVVMGLWMTAPANSALSLHVSASDPYTDLSCLDGWLWLQHALTARSVVS